MKGEELTPKTNTLSPDSAALPGRSPPFPGYCPANVIHPRALKNNDGAGRERLPADSW